MDTPHRRNGRDWLPKDTECAATAMDSSRTKSSAARAAMDPKDNLNAARAAPYSGHHMRRKGHCMLGDTTCAATAAAYPSPAYTAAKATNYGSSQDTGLAVNGHNKPFDTAPAATATKVSPLRPPPGTDLAATATLSPLLPTC